MLNNNDNSSKQHTTRISNVTMRTEDEIIIMVELASLIMVEEDEETTIGWLPPSITLFFFRSFISLLHGAITCYRFSFELARCTRMSKTI